MPPKVRFPHGLRKSPFDLSVGEFGVFAFLSTSVGIGVYQLATGEWSEPSDEKRTFARWCPWIPEKIENATPTSRVVVDGTTKVDFEK